MPKQPRHSRVKLHAVYTVAKAADVTAVCRQTVTRWIRDHGLPASTEARPWLIKGSDLKPWLVARRDAGRRPLGDGEIYCLPCRSAKRPGAGAVEYRRREGRAGLLIGICPDCERLIHRVVREDDLARIAGGMDVAFA